MASGGSGRTIGKQARKSGLAMVYAHAGSGWRPRLGGVPEQARGQAADTRASARAKPGAGGPSGNRRLFATVLGHVRSGVETARIGVPGSCGGDAATARRAAAIRKPTDCEHRGLGRLQCQDCALNWSAPARRASDARGSGPAVTNGATPGASSRGQAAGTRASARAKPGAGGPSGDRRLFATVCGHVRSGVESSRIGGTGSCGGDAATARRAAAIRKPADCEHRGLGRLQCQDCALNWPTPARRALEARGSGLAVTNGATRGASSEAGGSTPPMGECRTPGHAQPRTATATSGTWRRSRTGAAMSSGRASNPAMRSEHPRGEAAWPVVRTIGDPPLGIGCSAGKRRVADWRGGVRTTARRAKLGDALAVRLVEGRRTAPRQGGAKTQDRRSPSHVAGGTPSIRKPAGKRRVADWRGGVRTTARRAKLGDALAVRVIGGRRMAPRQGSAKTQDRRSPSHVAGGTRSIRKPAGKRRVADWRGGVRTTARWAKPGDALAVRVIGGRRMAPRQGSAKTQGRRSPSHVTGGTRSIRKPASAGAGSHSSNRRAKADWACCRRCASLQKSGCRRR